MAEAERFNFFPPSSLERHRAAAGLPLVCLPLCATELPRELGGLADNDELVLRDEAAEYDVVISVAKAKHHAEARVARIRAGQLTVRVAAALLAAATDDTKVRAYGQLVRAFERGELVFRETAGHYKTTTEQHSHFPSDLRDDPHYLLAEIYGDSGAYTTREEINRWLESTGNPKRLPPLPSEQSKDDTEPTPGLRDSDRHSDSSPVSDPQSTEEAPAARQCRRFERLKKLGGERKWLDGRWQAGGRRGALAALAREELAAGRPMAGDKEVRKDVDAEAERRRSSSALPKR